MSENTITLTETAKDLIRKDVNTFRTDKVRYAAYVAEMSVTPETVAAHVAEFRNAFKAKFPKAGGDEVKAYATKVRNGLNYQVGKATTSNGAITLRVNLSGEGGGSTVVPADHPLYEVLVALVHGEVIDQAA